MKVETGNEDEEAKEKREAVHPTRKASRRISSTAGKQAPDAIWMDDRRELIGQTRQAASQSAGRRFLEGGTTLADHQLGGQQDVLVFDFPQQNSRREAALFFALLRHRCQRRMQYAGFWYAVKPDDV